MRATQLLLKEHQRLQDAYNYLKGKNQKQQVPYLAKIKIKSPVQQQTLYNPQSSLQQQVNDILLMEQHDLVNVVKTQPHLQQNGIYEQRNGEALKAQQQKSYKLPSIRSNVDMDNQDNSSARKQSQKEIGNGSNQRNDNFNYNQRKNGPLSHSVGQQQRKFTQNYNPRQSAGSQYPGVAYRSQTYDAFQQNRETPTKNYKKAQNSQTNQQITDEEKQMYGNRCPQGYERIRLLGRGGCALVWLAKDLKFDRQVAIKQFPKNNNPNLESGYKEMHVNRKFFQFNGQPYETYANHPGLKYICKMFDCKEDKWDLWLIFEVCGKPLSKALFDVKGEFFRGERIYQVLHNEDMYKIFEMGNSKYFRQFVMQMAFVLNLMQMAGIVHSDLKPENILVEQDPDSLQILNMKVIDFGSSFNYTKLGSSVELTTPEYLPPEVLNHLDQKTALLMQGGVINDLGKRMLPWSLDIWSLGCIILEAVTGFPLWLSYKGRIVKEANSEFDEQSSVCMVGLFGIQGRPAKKIAQKQIQLIQNLKSNLKKQFNSQLSLGGLLDDADFIDLLSKMLQQNPKFRISPKEVLDHPFLISKEDELLLRNCWKLPATCQFINMFKSYFKIKEPVTPYDLEQSLLRPQHDPLCGEIMSRLLVKRQLKKDGTKIFQENPIQLSDYKSWNEALAKKFAMMYKNYRKFSIKYLGVDPYQPTGQSQVEEDKVQNGEQEADHLNNQSHIAKDKSEEIKQQDTVLPANDDSKENKRKTRKTISDLQPSINTFEPRTTRRSKVQEQQNAKPQPKGANLKSQKKTVSPPQPPKYEPEWSCDFKENLLQCEEANFVTKFAHDYQNQWGCETIQIAKLFQLELGNQDPFFIQGKEDVKDGNGQGATYSLDVDQFDDYEDSLLFGANKIEIEFKKFHEILVKHRLDVLYFLCQNKLDSESIEFQPEIMPLTQQKPTKLEVVEGQPPKFSDELKVLQEPVVIANLKPLGELNETVEEFQKGKYYYFPQFQDTRLYYKNENQDFELLTEDVESIQSFIQILKSQPQERKDCHDLAAEMDKQEEFYKRFSEEMKRKEASKIRKLQSQIRSRKLMDRNRQKLQFEGKQSQLQTDYLHHTQGKVMTRTQVNTIKEKITKGAESKRATRGAPQKDLYKEKYEKEKQERQKRLEKRMQLKENGGKRGRKDSDDYDEESYGDEQYPILKRQKKEELKEQDINQGNGDEQTIVMTGSLLLIYKRNPENENEICELTVVMKGSWRLSNDEFLQDLIYKKVGDAQQENLLREYQNEDKSQWLPVQNQVGDQMILNNHFNMVQRLLSCQGLFDGYFVYNEQEIQEKFSMVLSRSYKGHDKRYPIFCYGENNIGPFIMEGHLNVTQAEKLREKDGVQGFKKLKFGKFTLQRQYRTKILEEMVEELRVQRKGVKIEIPTNPGQHLPPPIKPYFQITKVSHFNPEHSVSNHVQPVQQKLPSIQYFQTVQAPKHPFQIHRIDHPIIQQQFQPIQLPQIPFNQIIQPSEFQNPLQLQGSNSFQPVSSQESTNYVDQRVLFPSQTIAPLQQFIPQIPQPNIFATQNDLQKRSDQPTNSIQVQEQPQLPPISSVFNSGNFTLHENSSHQQQQSNGQK